MKYLDILEMEEPLNCAKCQYSTTRNVPVCTKLDVNIELDDISAERLKDCPLRKFPEKQVCNYYNFESFNNGVAKGWNDCIDHITGEGTVQ